MHNGLYTPHHLLAWCKIRRHELVSAVTADLSRWVCGFFSTETPRLSASETFFSQPQHRTFLGFSDFGGEHSHRLEESVIGRSNAVLSIACVCPGVSYGSRFTPT